ncbi:putative serine/threonine-protein kinase MEC1 like protein [Astathelohania contejeani]|uniref:Serine/threonine-protein kinase MEC1 like protein n=1 Tax=Astathelohania contejeani TaxID=164912 RepID=A0ABQ7I047_9MICR|nr:putative serine/threonine-protein kinase MEC1 like protein [Thelohania contejeani]
MDREYIENQIIQKLEEQPDYHVTFINSLKKIISRRIIVETINIMIIDSKGINDIHIILIDFMYQQCIENIYFYQLFPVNEIIRYVSSVSLSLNLYNSLHKLLSLFKLPKPSFNNILFFKRNILNYALIKNITNSYEIDSIVKEKGMMYLDLERNIDFQLVADMIINNQSIKPHPLLQHILLLNHSNNRDILLHILGQNVENLLDQQMIPFRFNNFINPFKIRNVDLSNYIKLYLCFINAENNKCRICNNEISSNHYKFVSVHELRIKILLKKYIQCINNEDDINEVKFYLSHNCGEEFKLISNDEKNISHNRIYTVRLYSKHTLNLIMHFIFNKSEQIIIPLLKGVNDKSLIEVFKRIDSDNNAKKFTMCLNVISFLFQIDHNIQNHFDESLIFAAFVVLFNGFIKYKSDLFICALTKKVYKQHKNLFIKVNDAVFEYIYNSNIKYEEYIVHLSELHNISPTSLVELNMIYIFPILYFKNMLEDYDEEDFIFKNAFYLVIDDIFRQMANNIEYPILQNEYIGYNVEEIIKIHSVPMLVLILCKTEIESTKLIILFNKIFNIEIRNFIISNLTPILFYFKNIVIEGFIPIKTCVYEVLKHIIVLIASEKYIGQIFPFIEFFMGNGLKCECNFISWLYKTFPNCTLIYSLLDELQLFEIISSTDQTTSIEKQIDNGLCLLDTLLSSTSLYSQNIALTKAINLWYKIFKFDTILLDRDSLFIKAYDNPMLKNKIISVYKKMISTGIRTRNTKLPEFIAQIGLIMPPVSIQEENKDFRLKETSHESIAIALLSQHLLYIDNKQQDIYFYVIQETLKFTTKPLSGLQETIAEQFRSTKYYVELEFTPLNQLIVDKGIKYEQFIERFLNYVLVQMQNQFIEDNYEYSLSDSTEVFKETSKGGSIKEKNYFLKYFDLLKYGELFKTEIQEFYLLCGIAVLGSHLTEDITAIIKWCENNKQQKDILKFLIRINIFTGKSIVNDEDLLRLSIKLEEHLYTIMLIEKLIRKGNTIEKHIWDSFQNAFYRVGDLDGVLAINNFIDFPDPINLFYTFSIQQNYGMANACLQQDLKEEQIETIVMKMKRWDMFYDNPSPINDKIVILHLKKDYELIKENPNKGFEIVEKRRNYIRLDERILKFHDYLISKNTNNSTVGFNLSKIRYYRKSCNYEKCIEEISKMLLNKEWCVMYEHAKLLLQQNKINECRQILMKLINITGDNKSEEYKKKAIALNAILLNTPKGYLEAISRIKNNSKLFYSHGKLLESKNPIMAIQSYKDSLICNSESKPRLFQILPRIWHILCEDETIKDYKKGASIVLELLNYLPSSSLLPFFNQINTKISHNNTEIAKAVEAWVTKMINEHPHRTLWQALILINSQHTLTKARMNTITMGLSFKSRLILDTLTKFTAHLTAITHHRGQNLSIKTHFPDFKKGDWSNIAIPNSDFRVMISEIKDEILTYPSLQAPKKITFVGEDGKEYSILVKAKDDLRKDSRFMDLNELVNDIINTNYNSSYNTPTYTKIRTYSVLPITHNNGVIEWIDGLITFKNICMTQYKISLFTKIYQRFRIRKRIGLENWGAVKELFPPLFHKWFEDAFATPHSWFVARKRWVSTYATMCAVGWFMGLGDRHGENILMDSNTGEAVHVDYNCIFEAGKRLDVPERVPFRLTQNVIDSFGVLSLDGGFRRTFYTILDLLIKNRELVISNLLSFVYDPLFEWRKNGKEGINCKEILAELNRKLNCVDDIEKLGDELIVEAMNENNLSNMFIGWASFL